MRKIDSIDMIQAKLPEGDFKECLLRKFNGIMQEYGLDGISGIFSVILLEKEEISYISNKYLEFCEKVTFDNVTWLHTVWAASDGYSEDIYIPYSESAKAAIERRCL